MYTYDNIRFFSTFCTGKSNSLILNILSGEGFGWKWCHQVKGGAVNGANVFCFLSSLLFLPPGHHDSVWLLPVISLLITNTVSLVRACQYQSDRRGFVGPKKKTTVCLLYLIPRWEQRFLANSARYPSWKSPLNFPGATLYKFWQ